MSDPTMVGRTRRMAGRALLTTLTALAVAGCGGVGGDSGADGAETGGAGGESAKPPVSRVPQSPSPAVTAADGSVPRSPSPAVTAADGSNPKACADGNCEITVSAPVTIDFTIPDGPAKLSVTKVGENEVAYQVTSGDSKTSGEWSGDGSSCVAVFTKGGSRSVCGVAGEPPDKEDGAVVMQVVPGADGTAILRLVSD
ncbi:hypothetical protein ABZ897_47005 [Nonomuraea sp. NPDC046802]|uniref:hypothetical protein n=1 Tax=Nonomuraea sp. NPDC046802 TaxID=3154919 RepID=UPI0033FE50B0